MIDLLRYRIRIVIIILSLFSAGLVAGMLLHRQITAQEFKTVAGTVARLSNSWSRAEFNAGAPHSRTGHDTARELSAASNTLAVVDARLLKASEDLKAFQEELDRRQARLHEVEAQREELRRRLDALTHALTSRDQEIDAVKRQLTLAEDDRDFLLKEYKRLHQATADLALGLGKKAPPPK